MFLVGYNHAFRFCPGGKHVEYREHSKTPHEGAIEFISLDMHKGAGESLVSGKQGAVPEKTHKCIKSEIMETLGSNQGNSIFTQQAH